MARAGNNHKGGRPKGSKAGHTLLALTMRRVLVKTVHKNLKPILQAQVDAATGLVKQEMVKVGDKSYPRYYIQGPDSQSARYLLDQSLGKAKETIEHQGEIRTLAEIVTELDKN